MWQPSRRCDVTTVTGGLVTVRARAVTVAAEFRRRRESTCQCHVAPLQPGRAADSESEAAAAH
jgi:hypothetical protein